MNDKIETASPITIFEDGTPQEAQESAITRIEESRAVQEAQAQFIVAKRFPRDEIRAEQKIVEACKRQSLAQVAEYSYSRGGASVRGASIRLAETMARHWGNIRFGFRELSQGAGVSEVQAYAIDMETNTLQERVFHVKHTRYSKAGGMQRLTDPRDIYEMIANLAARRIRACILSLIPGDVQEGALAQCEETLKGGGGKPLKDRIKTMLAKFKELEVSQEMIEARYRKKAEAIDEIQLIDLTRIFNSLRDGMSSVEDYFSDENQSVKETLKKRTRKPQDAPPKQPPSTTGNPPNEERGGKAGAGLAKDVDQHGEISQEFGSLEEERQYTAQWQAILQQAILCGKAEDFAVRVMERLAAGQGGMSGPGSIHGQANRTKFLKDWADMVGQWQAAAQKPVVD